MDQHRDNDIEPGEQRPPARRAGDPPRVPVEHGTEPEPGLEIENRPEQPELDGLLTPRNYDSPLPPPELVRPAEQPPEPPPPPQLPGAYPPPPAAKRQAGLPQAWPPPQPQAPRAARGAIEVEHVTWTPAGLAPRVLAFCIDAVILALAGQALVLIAGIPEPDLAQVLDAYLRLWSELLASGMPTEHTLAQLTELARPIQLAGWLSVAMYFCYFTTFHWLAGGTLGKLCLGLRVLRRDGRRLSLGWAALRYLGYFLCSKLVYTAWFIPLDAEKRTLYDLALGTNVFKMKR